MLIITQSGGEQIPPRAIHLIQSESAGRAATYHTTNPTWRQANGKLFSHSHPHTHRLPLIFILLLLVFSIPTADARTLVSRTIDYAQYGNFLAERGYGNVLWNYTYDDGVYILKAELRPQLFPGNLYGDASPADIKLATSTRGYSSKYTYVIMNCVSELYYQHGEVTRSSYGCGDEMIRDYEFNEERYNIFKNNLVQRQLTQNFQPDVDRIFVNGAQWIPVQKGTATITSDPSGATVNGYGNTPITISQKAGTQEITVSRDGYKPLTKSITFTDGVYGSAGSSASEHFILEIIPPTTGTTTISTVPAGAELFLDGINIGTAPQTITRAGGVYSVRAIKTGYTDQTQAITVANGITTTAIITLILIPPTPVATTAPPPVATTYPQSTPGQTTPPDTYIEEPCPAGTYLNDEINLCVPTKDKNLIYYQVGGVVLLMILIIFSITRKENKKRR